MKILLLQLPLQSHDFFFSQENIPLAAASLQAIAIRRGIEAEILPDPLMSFGSDQAIVQYVMDAKPDLVGLSCYLWNVERSLFLAREIKRAMPGCFVVLGGPEVTLENRFLLESKNFDLGVIGEGEEVWDGLLASFPKIPFLSGILLRSENGEWQATGRPLQRPLLGRLPSPFLAGLLDGHLKKVLWLETVRGCAYRCAYCSYHKHSPRLRTFPISRILMEVERARNRGLQEVVLLDPSFSRRPKLKVLLEGIIDRNPDRRLRFHAECTAEGLDEETVERMARAGFVHLEVGLQSTSRAALRNIHRSFDDRRFLQSIQLLQAHGIEVMVDLIAGLPGERLVDICHSLDWVVDHEAYDYLMLYPLSLIPGTELHQKATQFGLEAMPHPPYLLTRTPSLTASEMVEAFHYYEESMGEEVTPLEVPPLLSDSPQPASLPHGLCYRIDWAHPGEIKISSFGGYPTAYALTVGMTKDVLRKPGAWVPVLNDHLEKNPFTLLSIEIPPETLLDEMEPLWQLARGRSHPVDRDYTVTHSPYRSFLVFSRFKGLLWKWPDPREYHPFVLHDGQKISFHPVCRVLTPGEEIPSWFVDHIHRRYTSPPEIARWEPPRE